MTLISGSMYKDSIRDLKLKAYAFGKPIDNPLEHELTAPAIDAVALTYDLALDPDYKDKITTMSPFTNQRVNRLTHLYQSADDLIKRYEFMRDCTKRHGMCIGARCAGAAILTSLHTVTHDLQEKKGLPYHKRVLRFIEKVQNEDLAVATSVTDPKGDRSKKRTEEPDMYLRIVEEKANGIVIRGAKFQISGATIAHELLVIPTSTCREDEEAYALCCAIPTDSPGITYIHGAPAPDFRRMSADRSDFGNPRYGVYNLSHVFFDDVFVPWDRVFICGETELTNQLVIGASPMFRTVTAACKTGLRDLLIGGSAIISEYNGVGKASHIMQKLTEMFYQSELAWGCIIAAATLGHKASSGSFYPNHLMANVAKRHGTYAVYDAARMATDISGGLIMCLPTAKDMADPDLGALIEKYMRGNSAIKTKDRIKMMRLMEYLTGIGGILLAESTQGGAPEVVQEMAIRGELGRRLGEYKQRVLDLAEIEP